METKGFRRSSSRLEPAGLPRPCTLHRFSFEYHCLERSCTPSQALCAICVVENHKKCGDDLLIESTSMPHFEMGDLSSEYGKKQVARFKTVLKRGLKTIDKKFEELKKEAEKFGNGNVENRKKANEETENGEISKGTDKLQESKDQEAEKQEIKEVETQNLPLEWILRLLKKRVEIEEDVLIWKKWRTEKDNDKELKEYGKVLEEAVAPVLNGFAGMKISFVNPLKARKFGVHRGIKITEINRSDITNTKSLICASSQKNQSKNKESDEMASDKNHVEKIGESEEVEEENNRLEGTAVFIRRAPNYTEHGMMSAVYKEPVTGRTAFKVRLTGSEERQQGGIDIGFLSECPAASTGYSVPFNRGGWSLFGGSASQLTGTFKELQVGDELNIKVDTTIGEVRFICEAKGVDAKTSGMQKGKPVFFYITLAHPDAQCVVEVENWLI